MTEVRITNQKDLNRRLEEQSLIGSFQLESPDEIPMGNLSAMSIQLGGMGYATFVKSRTEITATVSSWPRLNQCAEGIRDTLKELIEQGIVLILDEENETEN